MMKKMQEQFESIQDDDNDEDYSDLATEEFEELLHIFEVAPGNFVSKEMKDTYFKVGPFELVDNIVNKRIHYDKSLPLQEHKNKKDIYFYGGQVNKKGEPHGIGRNMNFEHALLFEGEYD